MDDVKKIGVLEPRASLTRSNWDVMYGTVMDLGYLRSPEWFLSSTDCPWRGFPRLISQTREREHLTPTGRLDWDEEVDCCRTERGRTPVGSIRAVVYHCSVDVGRIGL